MGRQLTYKHKTHYLEQFLECKQFRHGLTVQKGSVSDGGGIQIIKKPAHPMDEQAG